MLLAASTGVVGRLIPTRYADQVPGVPGDLQYKLVDYGRELSDAKGDLHRACIVNKVPPIRQALFTAMAMIETTHLKIEQRDKSKDRNASSANVSIFNLSADLVAHLAHARGDSGYTPSDLNKGGMLIETVSLLDTGARVWGITPLLDFVRGGRTAFVDGESFGAKQYRNAVKSALRAIDKDPRLLTDSRRVEMQVQHV